MSNIYKNPYTGQDYDYGDNYNYNNGWNDVPTSIKTEKFSVSFRENDTYMDRFDEFQKTKQIKETLAQQIVKELLVNNYICFRKQKDVGFEEYTEYRAELNIVDLKYSRRVIAKNEYYFKNIIFTEDEINEALILKYAERMI